MIKRAGPTFGVNCHPGLNVTVWDALDLIGVRN